MAARGLLSLLRSICSCAGTRTTAPLSAILGAAAAVLLAACDYTVPLVTTPRVDIERAAVGLWERTGDQASGERLLILPLGDREYLVSYPSGADNAMFARGALWRGAGLTLAQLDWVGTAQGKLPDDDRTFQFASYVIESGVLRVRLLNPEVVDRDISTTPGLVEAIESNAGDPDLFREALVFRRVAGAP